MLIYVPFNLKLIEMLLPLLIVLPLLPYFIELIPFILVIIIFDFLTFGTFWKDSKEIYNFITAIKLPINTQPYKQLVQLMIINYGVSWGALIVVGLWESCPWQLFVFVTLMNKLITLKISMKLIATIIRQYLKELAMGGSQRKNNFTFTMPVNMSKKNIIAGQMAQLDKLNRTNPKEMGQHLYVALLSCRYSEKTVMKILSDLQVDINLGPKVSYASIRPRIKKFISIDQTSVDAAYQPNLADPPR